MATLTEEQRKEMEAYYAKPAHGLTRETDFFGKDITLAEYEELWTKELITIVKDKGVITYNHYLKDVEKASIITEALVTMLGINPDDFGATYTDETKTARQPLYASCTYNLILGRTFGDVLTHRDEIVSRCVKERDEVNDDLEDREHFGAKWDRFSYATSYSPGDGPKQDGDKNHFFHMFWRRPLESFLTYRGLDIKTPHGLEEASRITERLFGTPVSDYPLEKLLRETPEHLIERKDVVIRDALEYQKNCDNQYLADHPDVSFLQFIQSRRKINTITDSNQPIVEKALAWLLKTNKKMDKQAIEDAKDKTIKNLRDNPRIVLNALNARQRKERNKIVAFSTVIGLAVIAAMTAVYSITASATRGVGKAIDAAKEKKTALVEKYKEKQTHEPSVSPDNTQATTVDAASATNTVATPEQPKLKSFRFKGNRPILGRWTGWKEPRCINRDDTAFQRLFVGEFNDIMTRIQSSGLTFDELFDIETANRHTTRQHNKIIPSSTPGQVQTPFYIQPQDYDNLKGDTLSYMMNVRDVLDFVPVDKSRLSSGQVAIMEAIGPSMGWSIRQQLAQQQKDSINANIAHKFIVKKTQQILQDNQGDTNDVEAVFWAATAATKEYRKIHPDNNYLLLTMGQAIRETAGLENQDMGRFEQFSAADRTEAKQLIDKADSEARSSAQKALDTRPDSQPRCQKTPKKGMPWWVWLGVGAVATAYLGSAYWKEKAKVVR